MMMDTIRAATRDETNTLAGQGGALSQGLSSPFSTLLTNQGLKLKNKTQKNNHTTIKPKTTAPHIVPLPISDTLGTAHTGAGGGQGGGQGVGQGGGAQAKDPNELIFLIWEEYNFFVFLYISYIDLYIFYNGVKGLDLAGDLAGDLAPDLDGETVDFLGDLERFPFLSVIKTPPLLAAKALRGAAK